LRATARKSAEWRDDFRNWQRSCRFCGYRWIGYEEKETDVSIAVTLVEDAVQDSYDTAFLISGDSDLRPAVAAVKRLRPEKRIVAVFPHIVILRAL
jgi:uncharacterized LabA/DUF88 family protein